MKKTVLLVDVQNIYYTTRDAYARHFDYNRFWERATANRQVVKAIAYAVDRGDAKQRQFQAILRAIGFEVKLKPFIKRTDGSAKGDWDVGITLDAMEYARHADLLVLVSGDGDFALLVDRVRRDYGIPVEVYGVPAFTALALINAATEYMPVEGDLLLESPGRK
ncbi:NYN domain-containing protein [uncultured Porticoccus sp.]|uniref:LabA-like NYN domain-containing protein n=1 Tax=uncultured Porticoccus sp. TaxID=1256050 RepID=UPI00261213FC|nr:NYN domain-containing protein [uncultured Porticoccus sp.]